MSIFDTFIYENFTGDMDHPDYVRNHPTPGKFEGTRTGGQYALDEVSAETGISTSALSSTDPYDSRWGDVWDRSGELREENPGMDTTQSDQRATQEIFG